MQMIQIEVPEEIFLSADSTRKRNFEMSRLNSCFLA